MSKRRQKYRLNQVECKLALQEKLRESNNLMMRDTTIFNNFFKEYPQYNTITRSKCSDEEWVEYLEAYSQYYKKEKEKYNVEKNS